MRLLVAELRSELDKLKEQIDGVSKELAEMAKREDSSRRLLTVPGIGPSVATALTAAIENGSGFEFSLSLQTDWLTAEQVHPAHLEPYGLAYASICFEP